MNKSDLIEELARRSNLPSKTAETAVSIIFDAMQDALAGQSRIEIRGFGSFYIRPYKSYQGRNPKTKGKITVPQKLLPRFKPGKELKIRVNKGPAKAE